MPLALCRSTWSRACAVGVCGRGVWRGGTGEAGFTVVPFRPCALIEAQEGLVWMPLRSLVLDVFQSYASHFLSSVHVAPSHTCLLRHGSLCQRITIIDEEGLQRCKQMIYGGLLVFTSAVCWAVLRPCIAP